jgi:PAS domain S-box-containing protein
MKKTDGSPANTPAANSTGHEPWHEEFDTYNLKALLNNIDDLIWSVDTDLKLITSNKAFDETTRKQGKSLKKGDDILDSSYPPEELARWVGYYLRALSGETFAIAEYYKVPHDTWTEVSFYPILNEHQVVGTACHARDITEKKKDAERLLSAYQENISILESITDGFFTLDKNWIVTYWNKEAERMLYQPRESIVGKNIWETYSETIPLKFYSEAHRSMQDQVAVKFEEFFSPLNLWIEASVYPTAHRLSIFFRDITVRREHEIAISDLNEQLNKRAEELIASNAELEQFAYVASHDLQEPLRMVSSFLQLLEKKYKSQLDETATLYINYAVDGAERMKRLILDLLEYSRVGTNTDELVETDFNEVLQQVVETFTTKIAANDAQIKTHPLPVAKASKMQMTQLLQNLVSNSFKYNTSPMPQIEIGCDDNGDTWQFFVKDNGIGIDKKFFDKIFVIFQRLHNKSRFSGTGIGLAICKKIVERHGGSIWVQSMPGEGATFFFTIAK